MGQNGSSWRAGLDFSTTRGLKGGHPETEGVSAGGRVLEVHPHAHKVELDLTRYEGSISRTFDDTWDAVLRIPYFIKSQTATVEFPTGGSEEDRDAAIRSGRNHHRTATYQGFSDLELGVGWRRRDLLGEDTVFRFSAGLAVPVGETHADPLVAGDRGLEHEHIQFGNGTFDPILDAYLGIPLNKKWAFSAYVKTRIPLYENSHGYQGAFEATLLPRLTYLAGKNLSLSAGVALNHFGYAEWNGRRDPNSGQFTANAALGVGYKFNENYTASLGMLVPLYTKSYTDEDALDPAPVFSVSVAWTF